MRSQRYIVISPVRNEGPYIEKTIRSMVSQTVKPQEWVIVDDGSTDDTGRIIDECSDKHGWIRTIHRLDRGFRQAGGGVVQAFNEGYESLSSDDWDFVVKLDGDLAFPEDYFQKCLDYFSADAGLGIAGGGIYALRGGVPMLEEAPVFHVRGATKIYRRKCWDDIGGFFDGPGWDTLDEIKAHMLGWRTKGFSDLKVIHLKDTGQADGKWRDSVKNGVANYISGYHPLFMLVKCLKRLGEKPYGVVAAGLLWGYVKGYLTRVPQVGDRQLIAYLRRQQINRLLLRESIYGRRVSG